MQDRLRHLLVAEAQRSAIEVTPAQFDEFCEKMGLLFELIFSGTIRIEDIELQADDEVEAEPVEDDRQLTIWDAL